MLLYNNKYCYMMLKLSIIQNNKFQLAIMPA